MIYHVGWLESCDEGAPVSADSPAQAAELWMSDVAGLPLIVLVVSPSGERKTFEMVATGWKAVEQDAT